MPTSTLEKPITAPAAAPADDAPERPPLSEKYNVPFDDSRIVKYGDKNDAVLKAVAADVKYVDAHIRTIARDMGDLMYSARGVGLAAPQIGQSIRLLVYDAGAGLRVLINPVVLKKKGEQTEPEEGCLSIPGLRGVVRRADDITVKALDENGKPVRFRATDFEARIILHEIDHLHGILFTDLADPSTLRMLTDEEKADEAAEFTPAPDAPVAPAE